VTRLNGHAPAGGNGGRRTVLFVSPNSFVVRNWLASGLADLCKSELGLRPVFLTPFTDETFAGLDGEYVNHSMAIERLHGVEVPAAYSRTLFTLNYLRLRAFAQDVENGSIQMMTLARRRDAVHYGLLAARSLAPRGTRRRQLVRRVLDRVNPSHARTSELLRELHPSAVFVGSAGVMPIDLVAINEARKLDIPVHCVVNSWDNLTSRGSMLRRPHTLMVWNEFMKEQARTIHDYSADRIGVVGALQFVEYEAPVSGAETRALYNRVKLSAGTPYALFVTGQHLPEYEAEDAARLRIALDETPLRDHVLIVRVHPQARLEPFQAIAGRRVVLDLAPRYAAGGAAGFQFDRGEVRAMAALLRNAKVVIASWCTTALLEAALFQRPILQLRWLDRIARRVPEQVDRIRDFQRYEHLKPFDATGCRAFSDDPADFADVLTELLSNDAAYQERRRNAAESFTRLPLGGAAQRVIDFVRASVAVPEFQNA
jgi:hypothetical protein